MSHLLSLSAGIDRVLGFIARAGAWMGIGLIVAVLYDVVTRYFGIPRGFGVNATEIQESQAWLHTILFALVIGYAYTRQTHVRIDLIRDHLPLRVKYLIEIVGCILFLLPYCIIATYYSTLYAMKSYDIGEVSASAVGLSNLWIIKSFLPIMFGLLGLAGISQLIKASAGFAGKLPSDRIRDALGGDN